ncbi:CDP-alcohol phosphatidyltransferase-domain-containing protein [Spinellus fusiger]|nr:CDP-alcohol phosphatidyltransferase-domain-containing protein [Spinellus fusiger]
MYREDTMAVGFPSQEQLENLRYYKYAAVDKSFVTRYVLVHYWNWAITFFPMWIAPNLITLIGLFFMIFNVTLVALYVPSLGTEEEEVPCWVYFSFAAGLWLYSTFDNVDGRQARRTGTSSPLGELFDHGCDALNTTYISLLQAAALGLGQTQRTVVLFIVTMAGFYLSTAEEYYTGVLYLGYVNGPTEGIILTCMSFIISGIYGVTVWNTPLVNVPWLSWIAYIISPETTAAEFCVDTTVLLFLLTHCPVVIHSIFKACQEKSLNFLSVLIDALCPIFVFGMAEYLWVISADSIILQDGHFFLFTIMTGILFGLMASSIIFAHLTKSSFPSLYIPVAPMIIMSVIVNAPSLIERAIVSPQQEYYLLWIILSGATMYYGGWAYLVIHGFCRHLGIHCLVIRREKQPSRNDLAAASDGALVKNNSLIDAQDDMEQGHPAHDILSDCSPLHKSREEYR